MAVLKSIPLSLAVLALTHPGTCANLSQRPAALDSFPTINSQVTKTSIGLAFPDTSVTCDPFQDDFLVNVTTSLPYGYAGFTSANGTQLAKSFTVAAWVGINSQRRRRSYQSLVPIIQYSQVSEDGRYMDSNSGGVVTLSNNWYYDEDAGIMNALLRCQNCSIGISQANGYVDEAAYPLQLFWTTNPPTSTPANPDQTVLPIENMEVENLTFDVTAARMTNYNAILSTLGLD
ncbi:hypothetical protein D9758_004561 [Tetrapyrgos nigripes]|uniref:Uncharacterized protein n=1 Tax=Tetrapyrgos nigripes TaxID=182062 RepID=A0A8H5LYM7_9AGAR|nr:hypothetical protein D9758_004561 [Tetrapyrgos nigripes]